MTLACFLCDPIRALSLTPSRCAPSRRRAPNLWSIEWCERPYGRGALIVAKKLSGPVPKEV